MISCLPAGAEFESIEWEGLPDNFNLFQYKIERSGLIASKIFYLD